MGARKKLIIIGGKGNGTVLVGAVEDIISDGGGWEILGFLNDSHEPGETIDGFPDYPVMGRPEKASDLNKSDCYFFYGLISAKTSLQRSRRLERLGVPCEKYATLVHPEAYVSRYAELGYGVAVMPFSYIGEYAHLQNHIYVHGHAYIARNTVISDYSYFAPRSSLGAEARTGEGAYLGTSCTVLERVQIGDWSVVGAGSTVLEDVPARRIVAGSPPREIGKISSQN